MSLEGGKERSCKCKVVDNEREGRQKKMSMMVEWALQLLIGPAESATSLSIGQPTIPGFKLMEPLPHLKTARIVVGLSSNLDIHSIDVAYQVVQIQCIVFVLWHGSEDPTILLRMAETLALSLQASPQADKDKESLQYLIRRVNEQRGSFRNVTEKSLEEEIRELDAGGANSSQDVAVETTAVGQDAETKKEEVAEAREDIRKYIVWGDTGPYRRDLPAHCP